MWIETICKHLNQEIVIDICRFYVNKGGCLPGDGKASKIEDFIKSVENGV